MIWRDWYNRRLRGGPIDVELESVYANMEPEWLEKGAAPYNAELKRRLDELAERRRQEPQVEAIPEITTDALPEQTPQGARFEAPADGPIRLASFEPPVDGLVDTPEQQQDWEDIREKARAILALGPNRVPEALAGKLDRVLSLDVQIGRVRAQRLWSCFSTLRIALEAHEAGEAAEARTGEPDPRRLNDETADALADVVHTYNTFTLGQPKLIERDAARPGPTDAKRLQEVAAPILPVLDAAAADRAITTPDAADALDTAREALATPPESLAERQGTEAAAATARNGIVTIIYSVWRTLRAEPRKAWKAMRMGGYAWAGAKTAETLAGYRDQLIEYVVKTFRGNATLVKIIEFISSQFDS